MTDARSLVDRRAAADQQQFLQVASAEEALQRFAAALRPRPVGVERVPLARSLNRVLAESILAPVDVPAFDRANLDGFALRAEDSAGAREDTPRRLLLTEEVLTPGVVPAVTVTAGHASVIATGGMLPRGADAVVMVEDTELVDEDGHSAVKLRRALPPGAAISFAGSDIARGETILRAGQLITSREIGLLASVGLGEVPVYRRPRVAVISTGNELTQPGQPLPVGGVYDSNGAIVAAALEEIGCEPVAFGAVPDDAAAQQAVLAEALACDGVILSGGTSKGAGDLSHQMVGALTDPGIVVHGVAIKPGKPLCLAVTAGKPVVILPGFPTSAIFTFHQFVAPMLRILAGLPPETPDTVEAVLPQRVSSDRGRTEYLMVSLIRSDAGFAAYPMGKGSGAVTGFSNADGYICIGAQTELVPAGTPVTVRLLSRRLSPADFVSIGSHCLGLDFLLQRLQAEGYTAKALQVGSQGGLAAARRGECDVAGIHLMDPQSGEYNAPFLGEGTVLVQGYTRMQGVAFRKGDPRFVAAATAQDVVAAALADPHCAMVNRNAGSGTRMLIDQLLGGSLPPGYAVQAKSHNAVAAAIVQGRADWGMTIAPVAEAYGLGFLPLKAEHYDFAIPGSRMGRPAVQRFIALLQEPAVREDLARMGFQAA